MPYQLTFSERYKYESLESGITLETTLLHGDLQQVTKAKVDPGAAACIFSREIGESIGINIESGLKRNFASLTGDTLVTYGHEVMIQSLGIMMESFVYFSETENLPRNLLGREGWLRLVRLAIIDYDEVLYLSPYNDPI
jgi:hypothetical protein